MDQPLLPPRPPLLLPSLKTKPFSNSNESLSVPEKRASHNSERKAGQKNILGVKVRAGGTENKARVCFNYSAYCLVGKEKKKLV